MGQVALNLGAMDDIVMVDGTRTLTGGQVSSERANLLQANASSELLNRDISKIGRITTRKGSERLGPGVAGETTFEQALCNFYTKDYNYLVSANNGKIWKFVSG